MALQIQKETNIGLTLPNAYVKIIGIEFHRKVKVNVRYAVFASKEAADSKRTRPVTSGHAQFEFDPELETITTPYVLAYNHLKTLDGFTEAIDV